MKGTKLKRRKLIRERLRNTIFVERNFTLARSCIASPPLSLYLHNKPIANTWLIWLVRALPTAKCLEWYTGTLEPLSSIAESALQKCNLWYLAARRKTGDKFYRKCKRSTQKMIKNGIPPYIPLFCFVCLLPRNWTYVCMYK